MLPFSWPIGPGLGLSGALFQSGGTYVAQGILTAGPGSRAPSALKSFKGDEGDGDADGDDDDDGRSGCVWLSPGHIGSPLSPQAIHQLGKILNKYLCIYVFCMWHKGWPCNLSPRVRIEDCTARMVQLCAPRLHHRQQRKCF